MCIRGRNLEPQNPSDPRGLIRESFRIDGITDAECRTIFLDWALSLPDGREPRAEITALLDQYGAASDHPMTEVLNEGLQKMNAPRRRGGWRARDRAPKS